MFGTKKLDHALSQMSLDEKDLFLLSTEKMEYSYQLKMLPLFQASITSITKTKPKLMASFFKDLKKNRDIQSVLPLFSDQKRLKLGFSVEFFQFLKLVRADQDYMLDLKKRIGKNNFKSWGEYTFHARIFDDARMFGDTPFDYSLWSDITPLKEKQINISNDTYTVHFLKNCKELFSFGMKFNTCLATLATYKTEEVNQGENLFLIVYKNGAPFSSLSIKNLSFDSSDQKEYALIDMRSYNNEFASLQVKSVFSEIISSFGAKYLNQAA